MCSLLIKKLKGCHISHKLIKRLAKEYGMKKTPDVNLADATKARRQALKQYKIYKPISGAIRDQLLEQHANEYLIKGYLIRAKVMRMLRTQEETRLMHRRIKVTRNKIKSLSMNRMMVLDEWGLEEVEVTDKIQIEKS